MVRQPPNMGEALGYVNTIFLWQDGYQRKTMGCLVTSPGENGAVY
jgi:hypothetical protein